MSRQSTRPVQRIGRIRAGRDVVVGDQINQVELERVESLLEQIVALLRQQPASVRVERENGQPVVIVGSGNVVGSGNEVYFASGDMGLLGALQGRADPAQREEIYLARFVLSETYARWERAYLPLAGRLLDAPLRLSDRADQALSSAGVAIGDLRQALTEFKKTRLVILGEPGAGKTTTLHRLALDLACERLRDPLRGKLPFRVDLFKFTGERHPSDFLRAEWDTSGLGETYGEAVAGGKVCFLLDGVNQMPLADRAGRIERWAHWANSDSELPPGNWAVFACRTADYVTDLRLPEVHVQSLDAEHMRAYLELRFGAERAGQLWQEFDERLRAGSDRFERLARNPFMLSLLADRCQAGSGFTDSRAVLMDDLAYRLLDRELREGRQPEALTADPRDTLQAEMQSLGRLAFAMQAKGEGTSLTRETAARLPLDDSGQARLSLNEVLDLALDATVLEVVEAGENPTYAFYHHLLQEYFAAGELLRQFRTGAKLSRLWRVPWRAWQMLSRPLLPGERLLPPPVTGWEETVVMAAGLAGQDTARFVTTVRRDNLPLAGRCLVEAGLDRENLQALVVSARVELLKRQRDSWAHLRARIAAGLALGELGHPDLPSRRFEFEDRTVWAIPPALQAIPAGEFVRGSQRADKQAYSDEYTTERRVNLPAFEIGRYPVTNAEYRFFIEDGGYRDERWWSAVGWTWRQGGAEAHAGAIEQWLNVRKFLQGRNLDQFARQVGWRPQELSFWKDVVQVSDDEARARACQQFERPFDRPAFWDDPERSSPARPVVGVNCYEAEAYCCWLSAVTGREYRLPAEAEWEKAARGTDGRRYPWGDKFDPARCNSVESHVYTTTPVGLYPNGVSPYGLFDAAGNAWEWTADWYQAYPVGEDSDDFGTRFRAVRGGSWVNNRRNVRCAYRARYVPVGFSDLQGFRVLSPGS